MLTYRKRTGRFESRHRVHTGLAALPGAVVYPPRQAEAQDETCRRLERAILGGGAVDDESARRIAEAVRDG